MKNIKNNIQNRIDAFKNNIGVGRMVKWEIYTKIDDIRQDINQRISMDIVDIIEKKNVLNNLLKKYKAFFPQTSNKIWKI